MKRISSLSAILCLAAALGFAQSPDLDTYKSGIRDFAEELAAVLPLNSLIGLNWNDAYIGQFEALPHAGIGFTAGFTTLPAGAIENIIENTMGGDPADLPNILRKTGIPVPAGTIDVRISGFSLPLDLGLKFGYFNFDFNDIDGDYLLMGGDIRYCILEQTILIPKISIGAGFNYLRTQIKLGGALGDELKIDIPSSVSGSLPGINSLIVTSPGLYLETATKVIDLKIQASWQALIFEPSIGLGMSYGMSRIMAGAESSIYKNDATNPANKLDSSDMAALSALGFDVDEKGIGYTSSVTAMSYRLFGGLGFNLSSFRMSLGLLFGMNTGSWGATFGARLQL
ncbi:MAG: hypothetical protein LBT68_07185 [Spirochaetales bacterium]|jgi:hypothetical protein|nr:hypothetical protein [Spirochaetales bacterium]